MIDTMKLSWFASTIVLIVTCIFGGQSVLADTLVVQLENIELKQDQTLYLRLHRADQVAPDERGWDTLPVVDEWKFKGELPPELSLDGLAEGIYALRGFIDENENQELDKNGRGRPKEPFGFSYSLERSKPSLRFKRALFVLSGDSSRIGFSVFGR